MVASEIGDKKTLAINDRLIKMVEEAVADPNNDAALKNHIDLFLPKKSINASLRENIASKFLSVKHEMLTSLRNNASLNRNLNSKAELERLSTSTFSTTFSMLRIGFGHNMSVPDTIKLAQSITNVLMVSYSPIAADRRRYDDIINSYVMRSDSTLKSVLKSFGIDITKFADHKRALLADKGLMGRIANEKMRTDYISKITLRDNNLLCFAVKDNYVVNDKTLQAFKQIFDIKNDDKTVTSALKKSASAILTGVVDARLMPQTATRFYNIVNFGFEKIYEDLAVYAKHGATLDDMMNYTARSAFEICYTSLNRYDITREKQVELAQKLANLVINNYSPVSFTNEVANEKYADFVTKDSALLTSIVEKLEPERIETKAFIKKQAEAAKKKAEKQPEDNRKSAEARERLRKEEEAKREAEREAKLEVKRSYKREIANPIDMPKKIEPDFVHACKAEMINSLNDKNTQEAFELTVAKILENYGLERAKASQSASTIYDKSAKKSGGLKDIYDKLASEAEYGMYHNGFMGNIIDNMVNTYCEYVVKQFEDPQIGIIAAHDVIGAIIKHYSPVAFTKDDSFKKMVDDYLFENGGSTYYYDYYANNHIKHGIPEEKRPNFDTAKEFQNWIKEGVKELDNKFGVKYERKSMDKYERKVERLNLKKYNGADIITMNDFNVLREECKNSIADKNLTAYVKWQICEILADSGVAGSKIQSTADDIFAKCTGNDGMLAFYDKSKSINVLKDPFNYSRYVMDSIVYTSMKLISQATNGCYSSMEEGFATNQRILDVILKNYSPVAHTNGELNKYANAYMVNEGEAFREYYSKNVKFLTWTEIKPIWEEVGEIHANLEKKAPASDKEKISVDLNEVVAEAPKQSEPRVEAPKVEASNPNRERIVIEELANDTRVKDISEKAKVSDVPVASNVKN